MKREPLKPIDWAVVIGGPAVFLAIAWFGLQAIIGPGPAPSPVAELRAGKVRPGMRESEVLRAIGQPTALVENEDGTFYYRYQHSAWRPEDKTPIEEDGYVDFSSSAIVTNVSFDSRTPPVSEEESM